MQPYHVSRTYLLITYLLSTTELLSNLPTDFPFYLCASNIQYSYPIQYLHLCYIVWNACIAFVAQHSERRQYRQVINVIGKYEHKRQTKRQNKKGLFTINA